MRSTMTVSEDGLTHRRRNTDVSGHLTLYSIISQAQFNVAVEDMAEQKAGDEAGATDESNDMKRQLVCGKEATEN